MRMVKIFIYRVFIINKKEGEHDQTVYILLHILNIAYKILGLIPSQKFTK